jgi:hypothetical protein
MASDVVQTEIEEAPAKIDEEVKKPAAAGVIPPPQTTIKEVTYDGYTFTVDTDMLDDVDILPILDAIENQNRLSEIVTFMNYLVGADEYAKLKAYFVKKDGRFKLSKLAEVYQAIFDNFDPKG